MRSFGIIGYPLGHSFSKAYFEKFFVQNEFSDCSFNNYEIDNISKFNEVVESNVSLEGVSVTIPYKELVIPFLDELDSSASEVGAVNCVKICRTQYSTKKIGYNTDVFGFQTSLTNFLEGVDLTKTKALVLGSGGASKAVRVALKRMGIEYIMVSRGSEFDYSDITQEIMSQHKLIVNTTPLGMYPKVEGKPNLPYQYIGKEHYAFDLVYNPEVTAFMQEFIDRDANAMCGYEMLIEQAKKAWAIYNL